MNKTYAQTSSLGIALNFDPGDAASLPDWVELIPPGLEVIGRDGRQWINDQPQDVVDAFLANHAPIPIDAEHSTEHKAPLGEPAPAMAWIEEMQVRDGGSIWGRVEWTPRGRDLVMNREYRFLSPVFLYTRASGQIRRITSAGLTNRHNLYLQALNQQYNPQDKENTMNLKELLAALGLSETATFAEAMNAIANQKADLAIARNQAQAPDLVKFVPRADYDQICARATNAEQKLKELSDSQLSKEIDTEIASALQAGKITPATSDYHKASCRQEGGLERFKAYVKAAPTLGADSGLDNKDTPGSQGTALNAEQIMIAQMFGNSAEDLQKYGA